MTTLLALPSHDKTGVDSDSFKEDVKRERNDRTWKLEHPDQGLRTWGLSPRGVTHRIQKIRELE